MVKVDQKPTLSNSSKYKVLFLSSWYPTRIHEFNGDFVKRHAKAVSYYCDVTCLHVIYDPELKSTLEIIEKRDESLNEVIIYFKPFLNVGFIKKLMKLCYYFKGFRLINKKYGKPQIIHANILIPVGTIAWLFSFFYNIPFVITEHWTGFLTDVYKQKSWIFRLKNNFIAGKASLIIPVTENLSTAMQNCGITNQFKVVPNVVDTNIFRIKNVENKEIKQILHVSDLNDPHKNISGLLRAIKLLSETRQDFMLNIIHNHDNQQIIDYARELKIDNRFISFLGKKNSSEVAEIMSDSAFLVLFSNYENLPCVIVEALACGIPVLSTNVGGIAEYIDNEKGVLIEKGNERELIKQLNYLLDNYKNYNKENLHNYALAQFSAEKVGARFNEIYKHLLND